MRQRYRRPFGVLLGIAVMGGGLTLVAQDALPAQGLDFPLVHSLEQFEARITAFNDRLPAVPGEVLVKFRQGTGTQQLARTLSVARGDVSWDDSRWIGDAMLVRAPAEHDPEGFAFVLSQQPEVEWVQPNYISWLQLVPNDTSYQRQWNLELIDLPRAWDINRGASSEVTVAVIDSGVTVSDQPHVFPLWNGSRILDFLIPFRRPPDIAASRFTTARDFAFWNGPVLDMDGHGTHVAGTVLQETNNALGFAGVAFNATLMPLKGCIGYWELQIIRSASNVPGFVNPAFSGGCATSDVIAAIRYAADNGAHIINLSLGSPGASPAYLDALRYAVGRGVFVAMATGNDFEDGNPVNYPAMYGRDIDGAMSVGAVGRSSRRAYYSNTSSATEVVAPGGDSRDGGTAGEVYQSGLFEVDFDPHTVTVPRFDRFVDVPFQGTSMAAPHVAGLAALLRTQGITHPAAIEAAIKRFAKDLGPAGHDPEYGAGLIDARASLRGLGLAR